MNKLKYIKLFKVTPISLINSKSVFLSDDTVCISIENGDVFILVLKKDSMNNVRAFNLEKCASSVYPTTLSKLDNNLLFLGSRLGNSLLLKYKVSSENDNEEITFEEQVKNSLYIKSLTVI